MFPSPYSLPDPEQISLQPLWLSDCDYNVKSNYISNCLIFNFKFFKPS